MKKNVFLVLLAIALIFGLTGCPEEAESEFAEWVGTWIMVGVPNPEGTIQAGDGNYMVVGNANIPNPLRAWRINISEDGVLNFYGNIPGIAEVDANAQLSFPAAFPGFFRVVPIGGIFFDAGVPAGDIEEEALASFSGHINNVKQDDGTWIMFSTDLILFNYVWQKQ